MYLSNISNNFLETKSLTVEAAPQHFRISQECASAWQSPFLGRHRTIDCSSFIILDHNYLITGVAYRAQRLRFLSQQNKRVACFNYDLLLSSPQTVVVSSVGNAVNHHENTCSRFSARIWLLSAVSRVLWRGAVTTSGLWWVCAYGVVRYPAVTPFRWGFQLGYLCCWLAQTFGVCSELDGWLVGLWCISSVWRGWKLKSSAWQTHLGVQ